jgi:adenylosuccinate synthase
MTIKIIIGAQWGDEGKGKIVDLLAQHSSCVTRFSGGDNAGHTLQTEKGQKVVLRMIPSGALHDHATCYIGPGCVVNPESILTEIKT